MFFLLFLCYLIVFVLGLNSFRTRLNPVTASTVGFVACMCVCFANYSKWKMDDFHLNTFLILFFGSIGFAVGCLLVHLKYRKVHFAVDNYYRTFEVKNRYLFFYLIFVVAILLSSFKYLIDVTGADNISQAAFINYHAHFFEDDNTQYQLPLVLRLLKSNVMYLNYYFMFILANKLVYKEPIKRYYVILLICIVSSFAGLTSGSRGSLFEPIIYFYIVYSFLKNKKDGFKVGKKYNINNIVKLVVGGGFFIFLFVQAGSLFGRDTSEDDIQGYIYAYVGAQPKNLDLFMNEYHKPNTLPGSCTFGNLFSLFTNTKPLYELHSMRYVNGFGLGNVYTGYANYYYDFGVIGTIILLFFLGVFFQYLYIKSMRSDGLQKDYFLFSIFLYAYFMQGLILNFFGERVCLLFSPLTLKCIVVIYLFDYFVSHYTKYHITRY